MNKFGVQFQVFHPRVVSMTTENDILITVTTVAQDPECAVLDAAARIFDILDIGPNHLKLEDVYAETDAT